MTDSPLRLRTSRYNFAVRVADGTLLYNARSGAVQLLSGSEADDLARLLAGPSIDFPPDSLDDATLRPFVAGGFLVAAAVDELAAIRERFWQARGLTPAV